MTRKPFKIAVLLGVVSLLGALTASAVTANSVAKEKMPEYVGSQACLGCHADQHVAWQDSLHHTSFEETDSPDAFPGDLTTAPAELKAELDKADYIWRGKRFLAQDPATGEIKYLNVQFNTSTKAYEPYKGGGVWSQSCGGCHSGAVNAQVHTTMIEPGISCESCHGPGRDHILGKGDRSKIVVTTEASKTCAQCHSGDNTIKGAARNAQGYKPGIPIEEFAGFKATEYDPNQAPPFLNDDNHLQEYPQWRASAHAGATQLLIDREETRERCFNCHSASAGIQIKKGIPFVKEEHLVNDGVSCVACHTSHGSEFTAQLKMEPQALCVSCHNVGTNETKTIGTTRPPHAPQADMLQGTGAINVAPTKGAHTGITCIECHMSEGNHMMKVVKPADAIGVKDRVDSCTACHKDSSPESRGAYLELWQGNVTSRMTRLKADVELIDARLKANPEALTAEVKAQYEKSRANYWMVMKDNSKGAHNFEYTTKILTQTQAEMTKIKAGLK